MKDNQSLVVNNISVRYRKKATLSTSELVKQIFGKGNSNEFWALRNISFTLDKGDMLGVVGKNGAGKSTLMKAVSGTLMPASGTVEKKGTVCALLELGTGFDKDMTVKENIYLRGALLGYTREYLDSRYDDIIDFADMREFEENPFRTLSSGMKSRVAFSIASIVDPDIIILDEVFAVGDGDFRKKSQETMQEIINRGDTTALMVSHSLDAVRKQCNKVLWLHKGKMVMFGETDEVCNAYAEFLSTKTLPETKSLKNTQKNPKSNFKRSKKQKLGIALAYFAMLFAVLSGIFLWSQQDIIRAYSLSKSTEASEIVSEIDELNALEYDIMGRDDDSFDDETVKEYAEMVMADGMGYEKAAREMLKAERLPDDAASVAAARLRITKAIYTQKLEGKLDTYREEYEALSPDEQNGLLRYVYMNHHKALFNLERDCNKQMSAILDPLRDYFEENGQDETDADKIMNTYNKEKELTVAYYMTTLM